ncbi:hypothetical protein OSZ53_09255 [Edwardsiella ictaluri]|uniref:Uncharacterized protein n=1 Tax=Edwardsiella ictaluri (strain 93-146) TaxID=634503 RepID=C5BGR4_EDWI9|nr:hypothetical protein NT01EI_3633 [Edwardsiella ictaluri 93-146]
MTALPLSPYGSTLRFLRLYPRRRAEKGQNSSAMITVGEST